MDQSVKNTLIKSMKSMDRTQRAELCVDLVRTVYEFVKFEVQEGEGLDGRDGPERHGLAKVLDAAINMQDAALAAKFGIEPP